MTNVELTSDEIYLIAILLEQKWNETSRGTKLENTSKDVRRAMSSGVWRTCFDKIMDALKNDGSVGASTYRKQKHFSITNQFVNNIKHISDKTNKKFK